MTNKSKYTATLKNIKKDKKTSGPPGVASEGWDDSHWNHSKKAERTAGWSKPSNVLIATGKIDRSPTAFEPNAKNPELHIFRPDPEKKLAKAWISTCKVKENAVVIDTTPNEVHSSAFDFRTSAARAGGRGIVVKSRAIQNALDMLRSNEPRRAPWESTVQGLELLIELIATKPGTFQDSTAAVHDAVAAEVLCLKHLVARPAVAVLTALFAIGAKVSSGMEPSIDALVERGATCQPGTEWLRTECAKALHTMAARCDTRAVIMGLLSYTKDKRPVVRQMAIEAIRTAVERAALRDRVALTATELPRALLILTVDAAPVIRFHARAVLNTLLTEKSWLTALEASNAGLSVDGTRNLIQKLNDEGPGKMPAKWLFNPAKLISQDISDRKKKKKQYKKPVELPRQVVIKDKKWSNGKTASTNINLLDERLNKVLPTTNQIDWDAREQCLTDIEALVDDNKAEAAEYAVEIINIILPKMSDGNKRVQIRALEVVVSIFATIAPGIMGNSMDRLLPRIATFLPSADPKLAVAASNALDQIKFHFGAPPAPPSTIARLIRTWCITTKLVGNTKAQSAMITKLCDLLELRVAPGEDFPAFVLPYAADWYCDAKLDIFTTPLCQWLHKRAGEDLSTIQLKRGQKLSPDQKVSLAKFMENEREGSFQGL